MTYTVSCGVLGRGEQLHPVYMGAITYTSPYVSAGLVLL